MKRNRSATLTCTLLCLSFTILLSYLHLIENGHIFSTKTSCVFYDKPPRTASTTIGHALDACLLEKGYTSLDKPISSFDKDQVVRNMLDKPGYKKSAAVKHALISPADIALLHSRCHNLLYISSCRPMRLRIASKAKYSMTKKHGSSTLEPHQFPKILARAHNDSEAELELEGYPFTGNRSITPDYVIRAENLEDDLNLLMHALSCSNTFESRNVHEVQGVDSAEMRQLLSINLTYGDRIYHTLNQLAEQKNAIGLKKARQF